MRVQALSCNNCGAPLDVPESSNYITCSHCGSRLIVRRTDSAAYTEVLNRIDERTERMSGDLAVIRLHNELERLDREWQHAEQTFTTRAEKLKTAARNHKGATTTYQGPQIGLAIGVLTLLATLSTDLRTGSWAIPLVIIVVAGIALVTARDQLRGYNTLVAAHNKVVYEHEDAEQVYLRKRADLVHRLEHS